MFTYMLSPMMGLMLATMVPAAPIAPITANDVITVEVVDSIRSKVRVRVENYNFLDMRIYAVSHGKRWRLGTVTSLSTQTFDLPSFLTLPTEEVSLVASPIGSRRAYVAQPVLVDEGDVVEFRIANHLVLSSVFVRP